MEIIQMQAAGSVGFVAVISFLYMGAQMMMASEGHAINWDQMIVAGAFFLGSVLVVVLMVNRG